MGITEYNIRILICHMIVIFGAAWVLIDGIFAAKKKEIQVILVVITILVLSAMIFSLFASMSYNDDMSTSGEIVDTMQTGSIGGLLDTFSIRIEDSEGNTTWYHTSLFASSDFKKSVSQLEKGETIRVYANNFLNAFYRFEKVEEEQNE